MRDHESIDARSLAFGRAIAAMLLADPSLVEHGRANIARWLSTCSENARSTLLEWDEALKSPLPVVIDLLTNPNQRATRLRQSNPFAGLLPESQRRAILLEYTTHDPATA